MIPKYASGSIFHVQGHCNDLENQLITFPFGFEDDIADATAYQLQLVEDFKEENFTQYRPSWISQKNQQIQSTRIGEKTWQYRPRWRQK